MWHNLEKFQAHEEFSIFPVCPGSPYISLYGTTWKNSFQPHEEFSIFPVCPRSPYISLYGTTWNNSIQPHEEFSIFFQYALDHHIYHYMAQPGTIQFNLMKKSILPVCPRSPYISLYGTTWNNSIQPHEEQYFASMP